ncbi:hypothetical protein HPB50_007137 [Hyalomma asiaticum]|uniref:Uncharacterized protein n=1 Tax=Hyalomma asiaticum TaxID=266040 RepID=A0ACB7SU53_HYAAI|nr:hypothetical protein HPB50_007137 [Hyalomma asiaticum]
MDDGALLRTLQHRYIATGPRPEYRDYPHQEVTEMDADITEAEVRAAIIGIRRNTTPGADGIHYTALRNLDDQAIQQLTNFYNQHWKNGTLPQEWRHADITLIPKPGKPLSLQNLRPISLTSCVGILFEHVVLMRLQDYLEAREFFPNTMFGYRKKYVYTRHTSTT